MGEVFVNCLGPADFYDKLWPISVVFSASFLKSHFL